MRDRSVTDSWRTVDDNYDPSVPRPHPATFSDAVMVEIRRLLDPVCDRSVYPSDRATILDPFAGVGTVHSLPYLTVGVEIEPEWAAQSPYTICADSRALPFKPNFFDGVVTSPAYGNRMADHHNAQDGSSRITYRHKLGRALTDGNSGKMQWGQEYRDLHMAVYWECRRVTRDNGFFILNISDHVRGGKVVPVSEWHRNALESIGYVAVDGADVKTPRMRYGQNHEARVDVEHVWLFQLRKD